MTKEQRLIEKARVVDDKIPASSPPQRRRLRVVEQARELADNGVPCRPVQHRPRQRVLGVDPGLHLGRVTFLQPAVRVADLDAVEDVDNVVASGRWDAHRRSRQLLQPRPMFGRLPWLALLRRIRALRFFVFLDIAAQPTVCVPGFPLDHAERCGRYKNREGNRQT